MRRHAILDVALALAFIGIAALFVWGAFYTIDDRAPVCPAGLPCDFLRLLHATVEAPISAGAAVLFFGIGARMLWNVWRGQG